MTPPSVAHHNASRVRLAPYLCGENNETVGGKAGMIKYQHRATFLVFVKRYRACDGTAASGKLGGVFQTTLFDCHDERRAFDFAYAGVTTTQGVMTDRRPAKGDQ